jgi:hypothetical protein
VLIKKFQTNGIKEQVTLLINEPKKEQPNVPVQAGQGRSTKAEKVRSSRYEWEAKSSNENEKAAGASGASRRSLLGSVKALLKKLFSGDRGPGNHGFFDNDDDASPSAA